MILAGNSICQEFGEISDEELQMTSFDQDPEADFVILLDIGEIYISSRFVKTFKYHKRIKILKESGKENGSVRLGYYYKEDLVDLEAYSYSPNGDEFELDEDNIMEEQVGNTKFKKFDIPGVEVGSVIEYKYTLVSEYISSLEPWFFQSNAFTVLSRMDVFLASGFSYNYLKDDWDNYDISYFSERVFHDRKKVMRHSWQAFNIPAIRKEPYMKAESDYYAKILFQLVAFKNQYVQYTYAKTWDDIAESYDHPHKNRKSESGDHRDFMTLYLKNEKSDFEKAKKIYNYIKDNIKTVSKDASLDLEDIFLKKEGRVYDKNMLLLNLLLNEGLSAHPFLISTRDNGIFNDNWPNISQLDKTIVLLEIDNKKYFLDTANKFCPFGYLTPDLDVDKGVKMMDEKAVIMEINATKFDAFWNINTNAHINDDGSIDAESILEYSGYLAIAKRGRVDNIEDPDGMQDHLISILEDFNVKTDIDTFYYENQDSISKPLILTIKYTLKDAAEITDNLMYLTPPFISGRNKNPYVRETRNFPVDYSYTYSTKETLTLNFPQGYTMNEKPTESKRRMKRFNYSKIFLLDENYLECRRNFEIGRKEFTTNEYPLLKNAYDSIVESDQQIIVLEKQMKAL